MPSLFAVPLGFIFLMPLDFENGDFFSQVPFFRVESILGAREVTLWLRTHAAFLEDLDLIPSTYMVAHNSL